MEGLRTEPLICCPLSLGLFSTPRCPTPGCGEPFAPGRRASFNHVGPPLSVELRQRLAGRGTGRLLPPQRAHHVHQANFPTPCISVLRSSSQGRKDTLETLETEAESVTGCHPAWNSNHLRLHGQPWSQQAAQLRAAHPTPDTPCHLVPLGLDATHLPPPS